MRSKLLAGLVLTVLLTGGWSKALAQITITPTDDPNVLVDNLIVGSGITVTDVSYLGGPGASGTYANGPLDLPDGIIITSGLATLALPPNTGTGTGNNNNMAGDPLCDILIPGYTTYDATRLDITFDLHTDFDGLKFQFITGSDEYPEYVGSNFNDVIGVFIDGATLVAFDPDGNPISINGPFYSGTSVITDTGLEYDGTTPKLQGTANVDPLTLGHVLTIIVCDAGDHVYDTGILIAAVAECSGDCTDDVKWCGDGIVTPPEVCDDMNNVNGDGCSNSCLPEEGWCCWEPPEQESTCVPDPDSDCVLDPDDNCPVTYNPDQVDTDEDGWGDACDVCPLIPNPDQLDTDEDGVGDLCDNCPNDANTDQLDSDLDGMGDVCDPCPDDYYNDIDQDGHCANVDNCPEDANPDQLDTDEDGRGDVCDNCPESANPEQEDEDEDGVGDICDNCPNSPNEDQLDTDEDGLGDMCDNCPDDANPQQEDMDFDFVGDVCDNCPEIMNEQEDMDGDGVGDICDNCINVENPGQEDVDGDNAGDVCDNCPEIYNEYQMDDDMDGVGNECDNCPYDENADQMDTDEDGMGDVCDPCPLDPLNDADDDEVCEPEDNCTDLYNPDQVDTDEDGLGDECDPCPTDPTNDVDADGICGQSDNCPDVPNEDQADTDEDGRGDVCDNCPDDANEDQADADSDTIGDVCDNCPEDPNDYQDDADEDGVGDVCDNCPDDANEDQMDTDEDGVGDVCDNCPAVFNPDQADEDEDGKGDLCDGVDPCDIDEDGIYNTGPDCPDPDPLDNCPTIANPNQEDADGDDVGDVCDNCPDDANSGQEDADSDGVGDVCDNCPDKANPNQADTDGDLYGDACDNCPEVDNPEQMDTDEDGIGDLCEECIDEDADEICDDVDNCPAVYNPYQVDTDGDGIGDACYGFKGTSCINSQTGSGGTPTSLLLLMLVGCLLLAVRLGRRFSRSLFRSGTAAVVALAVIGAGFGEKEARAEIRIPVQALEVSPFYQDLLSVGKGHAREQFSWNIGLFMDYQRNPLVRYNLTTGDVDRRIVKDLLYGHVFAAFAPIDWLDIGLVLPVVAYQKGEGFVNQGEPETFGVGDLRLHLRFQLYKMPNNLFSIAIEPVVGFPTGSQIDQFMGSEGFTFTPWLNLSLDFWGKGGFAFNFGYRVMEDTSIGNLNLKDELKFRFGFWVGLVPDLLELYGELFGATTATKPFSKLNQSPIEALGALRWHLIDGVYFDVGAGAGITKGYASPDFRVFAGFRLWVPPKEVVWVDPCPGEPEDMDGYQDDDGCADPDNDSDTICDPWVKAQGLSDKYADRCKYSDDCPMIPEDFDGFEDRDGCPDPDNDKDTICDPWVKQKGQAGTYAKICKLSDDCPMVPENFNNFMDEDGCPDSMKIVLHNVYFVFDTTDLKSASNPHLDKLVTILNDHPNVKKVRIEGHTDSRGSDAYNKKLSKGRAKAVVDYLVNKGIDKGRLTWAGKGKENLLVSPEVTEQDFQQNRRVEFHIIEMDTTEGLEFDEKSKTYEVENPG